MIITMFELFVVFLLAYVLIFIIEDLLLMQDEIDEENKWNLKMKQEKN